MPLTLVAAVSPALLLIAWSVVFLRKSASPFSDRLLEYCTLASLFAALGAVTLCIVFGPTTVHLTPSSLLGLRLDAVSATMLVVVSFIGWIIVRFSLDYLAGEARKLVFLRWMVLTLASVQIFVLSSSLVQLCVAWIATSLFLHKLLLFYPDRLPAIRAARKKFVFARISDVALIAAAMWLAFTAGTVDIATILATAREGALPVAASGAAIFLAIAALLKSAQFPTHGWLTEVMDTPTPVSALLHAGVVNAGGFLIIRFADVILLSPVSMIVLLVMGSMTALFGSLVMLTQPAVKTSLAWSTVAQMGFMILQCGLALFPLALLHIAAHSLYKAHTFLSSGSAVNNVLAVRRPGPVAVPNVWAITRAFLLALLIFVIVSVVFGFHDKPAQVVILGAILISGVAYLLAQGLADAAPRQLTIRVAISSLIVTVTYFSLQAFAEYVTAEALPSPPVLGLFGWSVLLVVLFAFILTAILQTALPLWVSRSIAVKARVHLSNGLYANTLIDRVLTPRLTR